MHTALLPAVHKPAEVLTVEFVDDTAVVRLIGDLDDRRVDEAKRVLVRLKDRPPAHLEIDATASTALETSGLAALASTALAVRQRGGTVSMTASVSVHRVVERCGIAPHFGLSGPAAA